MPEVLQNACSWWYPKFCLECFNTVLKLFNRLLNLLDLPEREIDKTAGMLDRFCSVDKVLVRLVRKLKLCGS